MVARDSPNPVLAVLGYLDDGHEHRLAAIPGMLARAADARVVDYAQATSDAEALAARLRERFTAEQIGDMRFVGVPRGGLIVLGMVAYALDLDPWQISTVDGAGTVVVVDDCALSGLRLSEHVDRLAGRDVVLATLYSHPELRRGMERIEPAVQAFLSARDLGDRADGDAQWMERWATRPGARYWIGDPEPLVFPWSEPDVGVWNPATATVEAGWRLVPPIRRLGGSVHSPSVQVFRLPACGGEIAVSPETVFAPLGDEVIVADLASAEASVLAGSAAAIWKAIVAHGVVDAAAQVVAADYGVTVEAVQPDVEGFVAELLGRGLLTHGAGR